MKIFAKYKIGIKNFIKKIVVICTLLTSLATVTPKPVEAGIGGTLITPVIDLLLGLGDGAVNVVHKLVLGQQETVVRVDLRGEGKKIGQIIVTAILGLLVVAAVIGGAGLLLVAAKGAWALALMTSGKAIGTIVAISLATGAVVGTAAYNWDVWDNSDELVLPVYSLSPDNIFKGNIPLFNVNFFKSEEELQREAEELQFSNFSKQDYSAYESLNWGNAVTNWSDLAAGGTPSNYSDIVSEVISSGVLKNRGNQSWTRYYTKGNTAYQLEYEFSEPNGYGSYTLYSTSVSAGFDDNTNVMEKNAYTFNYALQKAVARWYWILRTIAAVGMMTVLVYIGIRILISSTSPQKAKYKELLGDWFVGMILLFTMELIMNFSNIAVDKLTKVFSSINPNAQASFIPIKEEQMENLTKELDAYGIKLTSDDPNASLKDENMTVYYQEAQFEDEDGSQKGYVVEWHTDLMGNIRIATNAHRKVHEGYIGYTLMFWVMIFYMVIFAWTYIRRVIYMAFLTMISPLVALTYPIDKANDGKAQGFDFWFKEYIFNLLLQPMHLILYTLLISGAVELATTNWIYALVALGFIASAEKIVRQMFNFSKASTPGTFMGPASAALTMTGMRWLFGHGRKGGGSGGEKREKNTEELPTSGTSPRGAGEVLTDFAGHGSGEQEAPTTGRTRRLGATEGTDGSDTQRQRISDPTINPNMPQIDEDVLSDGRYIEEQMRLNRSTDDEIYGALRGQGYNDEEINAIGAGTQSPEFNTNNDMEQEEIGGWVDDEIPYEIPEEPTVTIGNLDEFEDGVIPKTNAVSSIKDSEESVLSFLGEKDNSTGMTNRELFDYKQQEIENTSSERRKMRKQEDLRTMQTGIDKKGNRLSRDKWADMINREKKTIRAKTAIKNAGSLYADEMKKKMTRKLQDAQPIKAIGRTGAGIAAGTVLGGIGLASGIASGDVSRTAQVAGAAAVGGYKIGKDAFENTSQALNVDGVAEEFKKSQLGQEEYKKQLAAIRQKQVYESERTIKQIQEKLKIRDREEAKKRAKEMVTQYAEAGVDVDNVGEMIKLDKFINAHQYKDKTGKERKLTREQAAQLPRLNKRYNIGGTHDKQKVEKGITIMAEDMKEAGITRDDARRFWNMARDFDNFTTIE